MKFRKKPVEIEAVRVDEALRAAESEWKALPKWLADAYEAGTVIFLTNALEVLTLEGRMTGNRGDWIIRGVKGELYPCKPDIFAATYETAETGGTDR